MTFQVPDLQFFVANLLDYKEKLAGYEGFKAANPNFKKAMVEQAKRDNQPYVHERRLVRPYERS
jgi:hypothetical protein